MRRSFLLLMGITLTLQSISQIQITDLRSSLANYSAFPSNFIAFNDLLIFSAGTLNAGTELWVRDKHSTRLLKDIFPGSHSGIQNNFRDQAVILNDRLYFTANDGENGFQLWSTDGTTAGTTRITSIEDLYTEKLTLVGNQLFFITREGNFLRIWNSDGTDEGTGVVKDSIRLWGNPNFQGSANGLFYFTFQPPETLIYQLWRSDGTADGTFSLTEPFDGLGRHTNKTDAPQQYVEYQDELYFIVRNDDILPDDTPAVLMKTDGTPGNTVPVAGVYSGPVLDYNFTDMIVANDKIYFAYYAVSPYKRDWQIWESDGTENGTRAIHINPHSVFFPPSNLVADGQQLLFTTSHNNGNPVLAKLDLSTYVTETVKDLGSAPAVLGSLSDKDLTMIQPIQNNLYYLSFQASSYITYNSWISDLSEANTYQISNIRTTREVTPVHGKVYFANATDTIGTELWQLDESLTTAALVTDIDHFPVGLSFREMEVAADKILFYHTNSFVSDTGIEVWKYDTTSKEIGLVGLVRPGFGVYPDDIAVLDDNFYYTAYTAENGWELWQWDGSSSGPVLVEDIIPGTNSSSPTGFFTFQDQLYFTFGQDFTHTLARLNTNGKVETIMGFESVQGLRSVRVTDQMIYFVHNSDLWVSDGTEAGTTLLLQGGVWDNLTVIQDKIFFPRRNYTQNLYELWSTQGTEASTAKIENAGFDETREISHFSAFNEKLIFTAFTPESGNEYWISDGTAAGTRQLADIGPGTISGVPQDMTYGRPGYAVVDDWLYLSGFNSETGTELWVSDGTTAGTVLVKDINPGPTGSFPRNLRSNGKELFFTAYTPETGMELWTSEGDAASTKQLFDLVEGPGSSIPGNLTFMDNELFFVAISEESGRQIWWAKTQQPTQLDDLLLEVPVRIFPNPTSDYVFIESPSDAITSVTLFDENGRQIRTVTTENNSFFVGDLPQGIYFMVGHSGKKFITQKFVKK